MIPSPRELELFRPDGHYHLAGAGAAVVLVDCNGPELAAVAGGFAKAGRLVLPLQSDAADPVFAELTTRAAATRFDRVDVLVCAAGHAFGMTV